MSIMSQWHGVHEFGPARSHRFCRRYINAAGDRIITAARELGATGRMVARA
ncbi:MAG: hypothetical protein H3C62_12805 [Gemmatimonadaceae bacterium]|nr:hypothetical protein [Gemmatimonadaceae bacterium]